MNIQNWIRKPVAFIATLAIIAGSLAVPGENTSQAFATTTGSTSEIAYSSLLAAVDYYESEENGELLFWEEMLAIYGASLLGGSGVDLREWDLPAAPTVSEPKGNFPALIDALLKGNREAAEAAVTNLVTGAASGGAVFADFADEQAQCMLALEIASQAGLMVTGYDRSGAVSYLAALQDEATGGFSGRYDGSLQTVDTVGYVALALAPFVSQYKDVATSMVAFFEAEQLDNGGFEYKYETGSDSGTASFESANSTALAVWGLGALREQSADAVLVSRIDTILYKALPALTKWQNPDGSFNGGWSTSFDSFTTRQVMIALFALATGENLFDRIELNPNELVKTVIRLESDTHLPIVATIAAVKDDTLASAAAVAWGKYNDIAFSAGAYIYNYNGAEASASLPITADPGVLTVVASSVSTRAAFTFSSTSGALAEAVTVTLKEAGTDLPLEGVLLTVNGMTAGYDPYTYEPLKTDNEGTLTLPAENFLTAGRYQITTSQAGISKDLCEITIEQGAPDTKTVAVRIEGLDRTILHDKSVTLTTNGTKALTAMDAIEQALDEYGIASDIAYGFINSIDGVYNGFFGNVAGYDYWNFYRNGSASDLGAASTVLVDGDEILLFYGTWTTELPSITANHSGSILEIRVAGSYGGIDDALTVLKDENGTEIARGQTSGGGFVSFSGISSDIYLLQVEKYNASVSAGGFYLPMMVRLEPSFVVVASSQFIGAGDPPLDLSTANTATPQAVFVQEEATHPSIKITPDISLPKITVFSDNAGGVRLAIPHGTTVTAAGADWDGTIALPTTTTVALSGKTVRSAIAVGATGHDLTFDQPVRLLLPGAGDKKVGFIDRNGTFTEITQTLTTDTVNGAATELEAAGKGEGKIRSGSDLAVWTNHFTTFVTYDDAVSGGSGSQPSTATLKVYGYDGTRSTTMLGTTTLEIGSRDTPISLLDKAGLDYTNQGGYIAAIEGLEEREHGPDSGWKYSVNGTFPSAGASSYILKAGDAVIWRYVTALNEGETLGGALPTGAAITEAAVTSASIAEVLARFNDVDPGAWYGPSVGTLVMKGILAGQSETRFAPMQAITRAEFAMILAKAAGTDLTVGRTYGFIDGKDGDWFVPAVAWARQAGIVSGFAESDGMYTFRPQEVIRRQDMAVMLQKFLVLQTGKAPAAVAEPVVFRDESVIAAYAKEAVAAMQRAGIINGSPRDGGFAFFPGDPASRAEAAVMVHFALKTSGLLEDK